MAINFMQVIISGLLLGGIYALISIGLTMIFGVVRIVNFAHGEFLMLAMYATFWMFNLFQLDPYVAVFIVTPLLFLIGVLVQRVFIQPILNAPATVKIFSTLGLSIVLQNLALMFWKADYRTVQTSYQTSVINLGTLVISYPRLVAFIVATGINIALFFFFKRTYMGKAIRAVALDRGAAMLMGINVYNIYLLAFGLGTAFVGIAGALLMPIYYVFPTVGSLFILTAFVVVILGGMGSVLGAFIGGLIIGLVEAFAGFYLDPALKEAVYFIIFILILVLKPTGLFGLGRGSEEVGMR
ncbi:branched-chain amino acid ABC transporter permease [Metallumcola ferriviriculae]|uniref:Branched-chain amino acid ABC transporter permease n=1 Tax=Metallumcola ferriviriculae TaxID=3039180 RepID=A0AAU0UR44_9FIRM|nr:branched-chain amino acid ABC transporter permease [Desulfitibacteraceae bacterium MK1]